LPLMGRIFQADVDVDPVRPEGDALPAHEVAPSPFFGVLVTIAP
jgi:hypothetical protein